MERIGIVTGYYSGVSDMHPYRQPQLISGDQNVELKDLRRLFGSRPRLFDPLEASVRDTISAKNALDGALIEFWRDDATSAWSIAKTDQHYLLWARDYFTGKPGGRADPITFRVEVYDNTHVRFIRNGDGTPMFCHIPDDESLKIIRGANISDNSDLFTFCTSAYGSDDIDLSKMTLSQFLQKAWTLRTIVGRPTCAWDSWRSWDSPCAGTDVAARVNFVWVKESPYMERLMTLAKDDSFKAQCCMGQVVNDDVKYCDELALANTNNKCDVFMDTFCSTHVDDPFCGCYDAAVNKEALLLPEDLQPYVSILKAQPRCWANGCKRGYLRKNLRDMNSCDITICKSEQKVVGDRNIVDTQGNMFCRSGEPLKKPDTGSGNTGGGNTGGGNTGSGNTGSGNTGGDTALIGNAFVDFVNEHGTALILIILFIIIICVLALVIGQKKNTEIMQQPIYYTVAQS